jgi:acetyl-CoA C-acetyltransferase
MLRASSTRLTGCRGGLQNGSAREAAFVMDDRTPILVGAGQYVGRDAHAAAQMLSPIEIAATTAARALADTGARTPLGAEVDALVVVRLFEHSVGDRAMWPNPFGSSNNVPWSVARRIGATPRTAIYGEVGGQSPQRLVNAMAERIHAGEVRLAVLTGAEAIASIREATRRGIALDWRDEASGEFEDHWPGTPFATPYEQRHGIVRPLHVYALFEQARRHARGLSLDACRADIAALLAPFSVVAAAHPYAQYPTARNAGFLRAVSLQNYALCEPYTKWMVAQDAVNQGAAVVLTSVAVARELGIAESQWVYLAGYGDVDDVAVLSRPHLAASQAQLLAVQTALDAAGIGIEAIGYRDFYSCFPIAVSSIAEPLSLPLDGSVPLTLTGGLPFFGGPGNNYSMHAIATMIERIRRDRDAHGLVVALGGYMSKHSAAVYSGKLARTWAPVSSAAAQTCASVDTGIRIDEHASGAAHIESYAAIYAKAAPAGGFVVARMQADGARCMAQPAPDDRASLACLFAEEVIGRPIVVTRVDDLHRFSVTA